MNWNTSHSNIIVREEDDTCPHLKVGDTARYRLREMDSFGPVDSYCMCDACYAEYLKETTPYTQKEDLLLHVVKIAVLALIRGAQNKDFLNDFSNFTQKVKDAKSVGFKRIPYQGPGYGNASDYRLYIGDEDGMLLEEVTAEQPWPDHAILFRYNDLMGQLSKHLEHEMPGGMFISLPVKPSTSTDFLLLEGNLISNTVVRSVEDPSLPAGFRWKSKLEELVIHPVDDYDTAICNDCHKKVFMKDVIEWKWYDFYPAQGDEPIIVCNDCKSGEAHKRRVAIDRENAEAEFDQHDDDGYAD